ncbi:uncharacterized protein YbjT (DUF2867 family) [Thermosporothrix hazakensis]|jgi:uncharacterized protein YbjT (DUF2867 family)|uniref:Uncharacterized protein YbjT (DUF2867 family) n=1 Tax=Thermosporothrix hazakensis TaxID=644383 RepID=A0A326UQN1_THEHA|nr:SDR family oxidoreductase [Thermosporothrix hazakensis]PZW36359.1 uncharacterized protein YbjT (DUF2867 family) [Thermosporothrix hazakensis]GCE47008.1 NmrA family transcriptional regulator [Thermosporothrix hazakensis]
MSSILITGATGTIGSLVIHYLMQTGVPFRFATRHVPREDSRAVYLDYTKPETAAQALAGIEKVLLIRPPELADTQTFLLPFVQTAKQQGVQHIVFLSAMGVEHVPFAPPARVEQYIRDEGIACTALRPSFFMQNLLTEHLDEIRKDNTLFIPAGTSRTSLIDARDIAQIAVLSLLNDQHRDQAYTLTGGEVLNYIEVAQIMSEELGRTITYANPSEEEFRAHLEAKGMPTPYIENTLAVYGIARAGVTAGVTSDVEKLLGRAPYTIRDFIRAYREQF